MNNTIPILEANNIKKIFVQGQTSLTILKKISLSVLAGEIVAIIGTSGSGKSTLLHILGGLDEPSDGEIYLQGQSYAKLNEKERSIIRNNSLGFIYQFHYLLKEFTTLENVAMPLRIRGLSKLVSQERAMLMLEKVGMRTHAQYKPNALSGGERQRIAIARALVGKPICVLADEPTGNLDTNNANNVLNLILNLANSLSISFIIATHDMKLANCCDKVFHLCEGYLI